MTITVAAPLRAPFNRLALLHTAPGHVAGFEALLRQQAPQLILQHAVDERLLVDAQTLGADDNGLRQRVHSALQRLASHSGARLVVCTCSTLGSLAETTPAAGFEVARIDRAMAEHAVNQGPRVLLVAAVASTLAPTAALLADAAARAGRPLTVTPLLLDDAWPCFARGDLTAYNAAITAGVWAHGTVFDVVVLAQASMAAAVPALQARLPAGVQALASPALGVAAALARLQQLQEDER